MTAAVSFAKAGRRASDFAGFYTDSSTDSQHRLSLSVAVVLSEWNPADTPSHRSQFSLMIHNQLGISVTWERQAKKRGRSQSVQPNLRKKHLATKQREDSEGIRRQLEEFQESSKGSVQPGMTSKSTLADSVVCLGRLEARAAHLTPDAKNALFGVQAFFGRNLAVLAGFLTKIRKRIG